MTAHLLHDERTDAALTLEPVFSIRFDPPDLAVGFPGGAQATLTGVLARGDGARGVLLDRATALAMLGATWVLAAEEEREAAFDPADEAAQAADAALDERRCAA